MWAKSSWCLDQRKRTRAGGWQTLRAPGRETPGASLCWSPDSFTFHPLSSCSALSPLKVSILMASPRPCSVSRGRAAPSPPSCPRKRLGSDHLDVWALPRGQGGSEGGRLLPAPTLSLGLLCCFCAKVSRSLSVQFCVLPRRLISHSCPCPTPTTPPKN